MVMRLVVAWYPRSIGDLRATIFSVHLEECATLPLMDAPANAPCGAGDG